MDVFDVVKGKHKFLKFVSYVHIYKDLLIVFFYITVDILGC